MLPYAPWLVWVIPMIGAIATPVFAKIHHKVRDYMAVLFSLMAAAFALSMIPDMVIDTVVNYDPLLLNTTNKPEHIPFDWVVPWIPAANINAGVLVDPLSVFMANVAACISALIMIYSLGYMAHEEPNSDLTRYWFFMQLFIGGMTLLVMSDNFFQLFLGWEVIGTCSYGLIGFWHKKSNIIDEPYPMLQRSEGDYNAHCGMKAFVTTRIGDVALLAAILIIYLYAGTLNFLELIEHMGWVGELSRAGLLTLVTILLFFGPIGKSAQFPLHVWLPEAMAGPTTVSALIHAATLVKAGVYLVARVLPMFHHALWVEGYTEVITFFTTVGWIGGFTAFLAASMALVAREIKKVLAYSTVSQIGYMMLALGMGGLAVESTTGFLAGTFHLLSHALFKALLFLSAGAILHATETKYMDEMGGLKEYMPITHKVMWVGALALSGFPGFSGFWSKDIIFLVTFENGQYALFALAAITAAMTAFYTFRMMGMTFYYPKSDHIIKLEREGHHVHEAPPIMWVPLAILAGLTLIVSVFGLFNFEGRLHDYFTGHVATTLAFEFAHINTTVALISICMVFLGIVPAYFIYIKQQFSATEMGRNPIIAGLHNFLTNRWYINAFYYKVFVYGTIRVFKAILDKFELGIIDRSHYVFAEKAIDAARISSKGLETQGFNALSYFVAKIGIALSKVNEFIDQRIVDGFINGIAGIGKRLSKIFGRLQTGIVEQYVALLTTGIVVVVIIALFVLGGFP
jgi:NADH-quinone oxidoreductase subunit L